MTTPADHVPGPVLGFAHRGLLLHKPEELGAAGRQEDGGEDHHGDEERALDAQGRLVGVNGLDGLAHGEAQLHQHEPDAVEGVVGEGREDEELAELEDGLCEEGALAGPEVDALGPAGSSRRCA